MAKTDYKLKVVTDGTYKRVFVTDCNGLRIAHLAIDLIDGIVIAQYFKKLSVRNDKGTTASPDPLGLPYTDYFMPEV
jgi:hypothetical protein